MVFLGFKCDEIRIFHHPLVSPHIVQKPHPNYCTLENWVILPWLQLLVEWNHL